GGYSVDSSRDDCSAARRAADSVVRERLCPDVSSGLDDFRDGLPVDWPVDWRLVVLVARHSAGSRADPDARLELADFRAGLPVGWQVGWRLVVPVAQHSAGSQVDCRADFLAGWPDGPSLVWPVCPEAP